MNNKGFKPQQRLTQGEKARLERAIEKVLSGEPNAPQALINVTNRITRQMGGDAAWQSWFVYSSNADLGPELTEKFHTALWAILPPDLQEKMADVSQSCLTNLFIKNGLTPGVDFSKAADGGVVLGDEAASLLKETMPPDIWERWTSEGLIKKTQSCPWATLEDRLGVSFRQNLKARLSDLIEQGHAASAIAGWMFTVGCAVSHQVVSNDKDLFLLATMCSHLQENHPKKWPSIKNCFESHDFIDGDELLDVHNLNCLMDVAIAAGCTHENRELSGYGEKMGISRAGLQRLSLVWRGDKYSISETIAMLDKHIDGQAA
jgi:hypothetical protein